MKMDARTASILLTDQEFHAIEKDRLRVIYRPHTIHWDRQFSKFKEPKQATLIGFESKDIAHLMRDTGAIDITTERPVIMKVQSRVIRRCHDQAVFPEDYPIDHEEIQAMDQCWIVALGEKIG